MYEGWGRRKKDGEKETGLYSSYLRDFSTSQPSLTDVTGDPVGFEKHKFSAFETNGHMTLKGGVYAYN